MFGIEHFRFDARLHVHSSQLRQFKSGAVIGKTAYHHKNQKWECKQCNRSNPFGSEKCWKKCDFVWNYIYDMNDSHFESLSYICCFSSHSFIHPCIHPSIRWAKVCHAETVEQFAAQSSTKRIYIYIYDVYRWKVCVWRQWLLCLIVGLLLASFEINK